MAAKPPGGRPTVVILGATSHIAKCLIAGLARADNFNLHLLARRPEAVQAFLLDLDLVPGPALVVHAGFDALPGLPFHTLINCVGTGTQTKLGGDFSQYFSLTEDFDNLACRSLQAAGPTARYLSLSSGAVYGILSGPAELDSFHALRVNSVEPSEYYGLARLYSEAKHRSLTSLSIYDLRLFSVFSRHVNLDEGYFLTDLFTSILRGTPLVTGPGNMIRDYLHPDDLLQMVRICMNLPAGNQAFDVVSRAPVDKFQVLEHCTANFNLKVDVQAAWAERSPTGWKSVYCSNNPAASRVGYRPRFTSLETIHSEGRALLARHRTPSGSSY